MWGRMVILALHFAGATAVLWSVLLVLVGESLFENEGMGAMRFLTTFSRIAPDARAGEDG